MTMNDKPNVRRTKIVQLSHGTTMSVTLPSIDYDLIIVIDNEHGGYSNLRESQNTSTLACPDFYSSLQACARRKIEFRYTPDTNGMGIIEIEFECWRTGGPDRAYYQGTVEVTVGSASENVAALRTKLESLAKRYSEIDAAFCVVSNKTAISNCSQAAQLSYIFAVEDRRSIYRQLSNIESVFKVFQFEPSVSYDLVSQFSIRSMGADSNRDICELQEAIERVSPDLAPSIVIKYINSQTELLDALLDRFEDYLKDVSRL